MRKTKIIILFITIAFMATMSSGLVVGNESDGGYDEDPPPPPVSGETSRSKCTSSIRHYVIEGGGYYTKANSYMMLLLNRVEMSELSGLNYSEFHYILYKTILNIEYAELTYGNLCRRAEITPYNQAVIETLKNFDYTGFMEKNGLNPYIFGKVESFLSKGDITGFYKQLHADVNAILNRLYKLRETLYAGDFPDISLLWRLNQDFSKSILFGQYVAQVFFEIK